MGSGTTWRASTGRPATRSVAGTTRTVTPSAVILALTAALVVLASCTGTGRPEAEVRGANAQRDIRVTAVSTRPEYVTGGDVLVQVDGVAEGETPVLRVDGARRPGALARVEGDGWRGLVGDLPDGPSVIEVTAGGRTGRLEVVAHPVTGPLFSGPHQTPFACTTESNRLGPPVDDACTAPTVVRHRYVDTAGAVRDLPDTARAPGGDLPADVATADVGGRTIPLVLRTESGVLNRGVYWVTVLDPTPSDDRFAGASDGWNGDLVLRFGGGCGTTYSQGSALVGDTEGPDPTEDLGLLTRGYAVATSTLMTFQTHCNDVLAAETALVLREHVAEDYGVPRHTIGEGGSGGAIQQFLIAQNYPGILDAGVVLAPFPDALSMAPGVTDCGLLDAVYRSPAGAGLTPEQRAAINGHATPATCDTWRSSFLSTIDPTEGCRLPPDLVYDPVRNPDGARCTLQDSSRNLFGVDPATGHARRPLDNTGVQYGLRALLDAVISGEEFVALNEAIGHHDLDGRIVAGRAAADEADLARLGSTGRILQGAGDSTRIPLVAVNAYADPSGDIHDRWRIFSARARLDDAVGGRAENLSVWTVPGEGLLASVTGGRRDVRDRALDAVAEWLAALDAAGSRPGDEDRAEALAATRPPSARDLCVLEDGSELSGERVYTDDNDCTRAYPLAGDPRRAAGQPLEATTARCALRPLDPVEYGLRLDAAQLDRLRTVFPDGVCDWSRPGVGEVPVSGTWFRFDGAEPVAGAPAVGR